MADAVSIALTISALIVLIGFTANFLFKKTGLPDMLILIFLGALFGPALGVFDPTSVKSFAPFIAALALAYILFDGGMGLNIKKVLSSSRKALLLAVLGFVFSVLGVCIFTVVTFGVPLIYGLLFGSVFGGSSSIVVISLTAKIKLSDQGCTILILESAITDILCVVISLSILDVILTGEANIVAIGLGITGKILLGLIVGLIAGFVWLFSLKKVLSMPFYYMLTLGIVMLGYAVSESIGGSGALSALVFGLILGNERDIVKLTSYLKPDDEKVTLSVSKGLKRFEAEIAFLIRTFFFVFLGIIFSFSTLYIFIMGILLSALLFVTRFGAVWITTAKSRLKKERPIMTFVLTRGLAAAVLATLPTQYGLLYSDLFINVAVVVIVTTAVLATVGVFALGRKKETTPNHRVPDEEEIEENANGD
ncbi:MAG: cation:proton antiporter [Candidatus Bathyarchaeota archaeon]|nr:cation:proton antiporter [Candidatus Bathyarchaeota archaeon]